jgi:hypothetical protein
VLDSFENTVNKALNEARDRAGSLAFRDLEGCNKL